MCLWTSRTHERSLCRQVRAKRGARRVVRAPARRHGRPSARRWSRPMLPSPILPHGNAQSTVSVTIGDLRVITDPVPITGPGESPSRPRGDAGPTAVTKRDKCVEAASTRGSAPAGITVPAHATTQAERADDAARSRRETPRPSSGSPQVSDAWSHPQAVVAHLHQSPECGRLVVGRSPWVGGGMPGDARSRIRTRFPRSPSSWGGSATSASRSARLPGPVPVTGSGRSRSPPPPSR